MIGVMRVTTRVNGIEFRILLLLLCFVPIVCLLIMCLLNYVLTYCVLLVGSAITPQGWQQRVGQPGNKAGVITDQRAKDLEIKEVDPAQAKEPRAKGCQVATPLIGSELLGQLKGSLNAIQALIC